MRMGVIITTSAPAYRVTALSSGFQLAIAVEISNRTNEVLYIRQCEGLGSALAELQQREGKTWQRVFQPICEFRLSPPIRLLPRSSYTDTTVIRSVDASSPTFTVKALSGVYRAVYAIHGGPGSKLATPTDVGPLLSESERTSNEFNVSQ